MKKIAHPSLSEGERKLPDAAAEAPVSEVLAAKLKDKEATPAVMLRGEVVAVLCDGRLEDAAGEAVRNLRKIR